MILPNNREYVVDTRRESRRGPSDNRIFSLTISGITIALYATRPSACPYHTDLG